MHGRFCFGRSPFKAILLLRRYDEGTPGDEYVAMLKAMTSRRLQFYVDQQTEPTVRIRVATRETLPKVVTADIRCPDFLPVDALQFSIVRACEGCEPHLKVVDDEIFWAELSAKHAAADVERWVRDMLLAANLTWPGIANLVDGLVRRGGRTIRNFKGESAAPLLDARVAANEHGWPVFRKPEFARTWAWLRRQPGFCRRFGGGPIGRALNAFTHIAGGLHDPPVELMWAMIGIEALFTRGNTGLLDQVRERSRLLIGDATAARKIVSRMYEVRSRFVHGDLDFSGEHRRDSFERLVEFNDSTLHETARVGVAILLVSIQELIVRDWSNLEFRTELASA